MPLGLALGAVFAVGAWVVFDSLVMGLCFGLALAPAFALALGTAEMERDTATERDPDEDRTEGT